MKNRFGSIRVNRPRRNAFDLSHEKKLSMEMGKLTPIMLQEVVPGDTFKVNSEIMMRLAPLTAPVMHRVNVYTHYFFVPNRLVYGEWEDFITGGVDGQSLPPFPKITVSEAEKDVFQPGMLPDYMGVPVPDLAIPIQQELQVSALPFRGYQLIYNEYFRDQTLETPVPLTKDSTCTLAEQQDIIVLRRRAWEKDYFTSALPFPQRGGDVTLPVETIGTLSPQYKNTTLFQNSDTPQQPAGIGNAEFLTEGILSSPTTVGSAGLQADNLLDPQDLDIDTTSVTINELRKAVRLQEWLEKNARAGSRYIEQIFAHFGVKSSDARLQRPEYLGGGKSPVVISEVLNTAGLQLAAEEQLPQGYMAGHGISVGKSNTFKKSFEEHGYVIGICSVLPRTAYQQGIDRTFQKFDKFDYYWPEFAHLGEQSIKNSEIFHPFDVPGTSGGDTWGYQSRYSEYKYQQSSVHGDFKGNLDFWHMGRIFDNLPPLNAAFVKSDPTTRIYSVEDPTEDHLYVQIYNRVKAIRPMPYFGTPTL